MLPSNENILWFVKIRLEDVDLFFAKKKKQKQNKNNKQKQYSTNKKRKTRNMNITYVNKSERIK